MKIVKDTLWEEVLKCMTDPLYDIERNFSLEKSKLHYDKWVKQWEYGNYKSNPAVKKEEVSFEFTSLTELSWNATQAHNLYNNLKEQDFNKWVDWYIYWQNVVVCWYRLKTFDEWLRKGLETALTSACQTPEEWVRLLLEKELGASMFTNAAIHLFMEWKIDRETLERLGTYESYQPILDRDMEKDIEEAAKILKENEWKKDVTVLTLKM